MLSCHVLASIKVGLEISERLLVEAEDVNSMGENKLVLGNKIHDVAYLHPDPDDTGDKTVWPYFLQYCHCFL